MNAGNAAQIVLRGCFSAVSCRNISKFPDDPGLSAATCDSNSFTSLCSCCAADTDAPRDTACEVASALCDTPTAPTAHLSPSDAHPAPSATDPPLSPSSQTTILIKESHDGCLALNELRAQPIQCTKDVDATAAKVLSGALRKTASCEPSSVFSALNPEDQSSSVLLFGRSAAGCSWKESIGVWLSGKQALGEISPRELLLNAGAMRGGCAQAKLSGTTDPEHRCEVRMCVIEPMPTVNNIVDAASPVAYSPECAGFQSGAVSE